MYVSPRLQIGMSKKENCLIQPFSSQTVLERTTDRSDESPVSGKIPSLVAEFNHWSRKNHWLRRILYYSKERFKLNEIKEKKREQRCTKQDRFEYSKLLHTIKSVCGESHSPSPFSPPPLLTPSLSPLLMTHFSLLLFSSPSPLSPLCLPPCTPG